MLLELTSPLMIPLNSLNKMFRISVIFRVRSAKAVKITDMDLIKRLGGIVGMFVLFLIVRTLVAPPKGENTVACCGGVSSDNSSNNWPDCR